MCSPVTCSTCGKTTWAGCGQHADQVMLSVPNGQRCAGHARESTATGAGFLGRMFTRA